MSEDHRAGYDRLWITDLWDLDWNDEIGPFVVAGSVCEMMKGSTLALSIRIERCEVTVEIARYELVLLLEKCAVYRPLGQPPVVVEGLDPAYGAQ